MSESMFNIASKTSITCLIKVSPWFWKRSYLNVVNVFLLFCYIFPLEKGLNRIEYPLLKNTLCQVVPTIGPVVLENIFKCFNVVFVI